MTEIQVIGFIPPIIGVEDSFNTFRLGGTLMKSLTVGSSVLVMDEKRKMVFGKAVVTELFLGPLLECCQIHGGRNHTEIGSADSENSPARLFALMQRIYGPHIAKESKRTTVVYLRRIYGSEP